MNRSCYLPCLAPIVGAGLLISGHGKSLLAQDITPTRLLGETSPGFVPSFPLDSEALKRQMDQSLAKEGPAAPSFNGLLPTPEGAEAIAEQSMHPQRFKLGASLLAGWEYDDNIHLTGNTAAHGDAGNAANSFYIRTPLALTYTGGATSFDLVYIPEFRTYDGGGVGNVFNQAASIDGAYSGEKIRAAANAQLTQTKGANIEVGDLVNSIVLFTSVTVWYEVAPKASVGASFSFDDNDYDHYNSNRRVTVQAFADYKVTPKTQLGLGFGYDRSLVDEGLDSNAPNITGRINWQMTDKFALKGMAGAEWRQYDNATALLLSTSGGAPVSGRGNSFVSPIFSFGMLYRPRETTSFSLDVYRKNYPSITEIDQSYYATGVAATVSQTIYDRLTVSLSGGYENADYRATAEGLSTNRMDNYWFGRVQLSYSLTKSCVLSTYYVYSKNDSNSEGVSFNRNLVGASLSYGF